MELTKEQQDLLNTEFPADIEKAAAEEVNAALDLYTMGFDKMAAQAAETFDASEGEELETEKVAFDDEMEKAASERAAFIARGYIDGLIKEGSERHGDELHYLYPFIAEKLAMSAADLKAMFGKGVSAAKDLGAKGVSKVKEVAPKAMAKTKDAAKDLAEGAKQAVTGKVTGKHGRTMELSAADRLRAGAKPAAVATAVAGGTYLAGKKKEQK